MVKNKSNKAFYQDTKKNPLMGRFIKVGEGVVQCIKCRLKISQAIADQHSNYCCK